MGVLGRPADVRHASAQLVGLNVLERVRQEKARLNAGVVSNKVKFGPVARRFRQVARVAAQRVRRAGRKPLVDADIVEAGLAALDPLVVFLDQFERRISHFFVIVPPLLHQAVRIIVHLGGVGNVVALP